MMRYLKNLPILILLFLSNPGVSQNVIENTPAAQRMRWYEDHMAMKSQSLFKNLPWQFVGPTNVSGRMTDVEVVTPKGENYTIYVAGASGGIWKTENEGTSWKPIFENAMSTSIGDLALDPQDQNIIWAGTGEGNIFRSSQTGAGIYKSTDGGESWEHLGLVNTNTISRIIVHPKNSDIVYVAASGHEWTNSEDRGVYKTTDGGKTWNKILYIDEKTAANDLVMHPTNPDIIYASTWQRIRKKYNDPRSEKDYSGSGIHKTTDGGKTWKEINVGLPTAEYRGRIGIDLCLTKPDIIYAFVDNYEKLPETDEAATDAYGRPSSGRIKGATLYRSNDAGNSWNVASTQNSYMENMSGTYGWVFGQIRVDHVNEDKVYLMGLALSVSEDAGKSFRPLRGMHSDHHGLWIDPDNSDYLVNVNDGGVAISYDGGANFRTFYNDLPLVQFFNVNYDMAEPFHIYGSIQDHGSRKGTVDLSKGRNNIPAVEFEGAPGGEGSNHAVDPTNSDIVYSAGFYGTISQTNVKTNKRKVIMPPVPEGVDKLRGQWLAPFILSPHNPDIIYHGSQFIHKSVDQGNTWEKISPDLTYNLPEMKGDIPYQTIFSISESAIIPGLVYAGTDDGRIWVTRNGGKKWDELDKGLPYRKWVSGVVASAFNESTVYLAQNGKRDDDFAVYLWKSNDYGKTWIDISNNIPTGPINVVREDPQNEHILYVGTDFGAYVSINGGENWQTLSGSFPTTYVQDLVIHPRDNIMIAATHGRGMWAIDVSYIQNIAKAGQGNNIVFDIPNSMLPRSTEQWHRNTGIKAEISYYLTHDSKVKTSIVDSTGKMIIELEGTSDKGMNFIKWDLYTKNSESQSLANNGKYIFRIVGEGVNIEKEFTVESFKLDTYLRGPF